MYSTPNGNPPQITVHVVCGVLGRQTFSDTRVFCHCEQLDLPPVARKLRRVGHERTEAKRLEI